MSAAKNHIPRPQYLEQLVNFKDKDIIKVITGIRRCGKSTLLDIFVDYLKAQGVEDQQIIRLNLEIPELHELQNYMQLYSHITDRLSKDKMNYVFIDEVQGIPEFEKAVDGLFARKDCDVYITGSNAYILSGELATLLSGRYVEVKMLPFSFKEYMTAQNDNTDVIIKFRDYLENSSFPFTLDLKRRADVRVYLEGIYNSVLLKDVITRKSITDVNALERITRFMFDNIGNMTSTNNITNVIAASGKSMSVNTVEKYLEALTESYILYRANRYDVKGKQQLVSGAKYYVADIGLRYFLLGTTSTDMGHILENVVYLELLRRGYEVHVGKVGNAEIDFIAINESGTEYYQVAYTTVGNTSGGKSILQMELEPLNAIRDHNPKYLLTMDFMPNTSHNGIRQINALEWLLNT